MRVGFAGRAGLAALVAATGLTGSCLAGNPAAAADGALERPDAVSAFALARQVGQPVQVTGLWTESSDTAANPDGSFTLRTHGSPVRVRRGGGWVPVDPTLRRNADGSVSAAATVSQLIFAAGGAGPAVRIAKDDRSLDLWWPTTLPAPTLAADTATYPNVWPEVDLVLTARADGFAKVLVVRTREAAANPALRTLRLGLAVSGLRLRAAAGGFVAEDPTGTAVFTSGAPLMWDSAAGAARQPQWPAHGDHVAAMGVSLTAGELVVVPDVAVLDDPATVYPVYLDPAVSGSRNEWAMISSGFPSQSYHNFGGDEGMGLCDVQVEGTCNRDQVKRLAWEFGISTAVHGTHVLSATFSAYETYAYDCAADDVQLWRVGALSSGTNWSNHSGTWGRLLSTVNTARKDSCTNKPAYVGFDATAGVQEFADGYWPGLTVGLKAANEGSMAGGWKRFRNDAVLSVTYNSRPGIPASLSVETTACGAAAVFVPSATPELKSYITDPDGETDLTVQYAWDRWNTATSVWDRIGDYYQPGRSANSFASIRPGVTAGTGALAHGKRYRWTATVFDPWSFGGSSGNDYAPGWAPWCEFEVDTQNPTVAPGVSSTAYPEYIPGVEEEFHGQVGLTGRFTFTAAGVADVAGYRWSWSGTPTTYVPAQSVGGQAVVDLTPIPPNPNDPTSEGTLTLSVRSVDRAGRVGPIRIYEMRVGPGRGPVGQWRLDDPAGATSLTDSTTEGTAHPATPTAVTLGVAGRLLSGPAQGAPTVAWLNGSTSYGTTGTSIVDTSKSFTVSVWVRPDVNSNGWRAIVSATGGQNSSFFLRRDPDNKFHFTVVASGGTWTQAVSTTTSRVGVWTHLIGIYDAGADQAHLYVNGVRESTTAVPNVYAATGALEIGRSWWAGSWGYHPNWHGAMAEVKVWGRVVSEFEAAPMAATQVGAWSLDGHGDDDSDWGRTLTGSNLSWVTDRFGSPTSAGGFNGTNSQAITASPAIRTDQSFTVVCWARAAANSNGYRSVVAANGSVNSAFFLRRDPSNKWNFTWVNDTTAGGGSGTTATTIGTWYHLAVAYDAHRQQAYLYVNGQREATIAVASILAATGPLMVGHDIWVGNPDFHQRWHGAVDDLRLYAGALPPSEIQKLYQP